MYFTSLGVIWNHVLCLLLAFHPVKSNKKVTDDEENMLLLGQGGFLQSGVDDYCFFNLAQISFKWGLLAAKL